MVSPTHPPQHQISGPKTKKKKLLSISTKRTIQTAIVTALSVLVLVGIGIVILVVLHVAPPSIQEQAKVVLDRVHPLPSDAIYEGYKDTGKKLPSPECKVVGQVEVKGRTFIRVFCPET